MQIDDKLILAAFAGKDFGPEVETLEEQRMYLARKVFSHAAGYVSGSTMIGIMRTVGLLPPEEHVLVPTKQACRWAYGVIFSSR